MTADEIREIPLEATYTSTDISISGNVGDCALFLREIAAQLAELNAKLADGANPVAALG